MIKPTVGRKVWFRPSPHDDPTHDYLFDNDPQPFDATIVYVHNDRLVNLTVTNHLGYITVRHQVRLLQPGDAAVKMSAVDGAPAESYCEWMPFQIGQSQADYGHEALAGAATFDSGAGG